MTPKPNHTFEAVCLSVRDGDTGHFEVDLKSVLGFSVILDVRFKGCNAPELPTPEGKATADFVKQALLGKKVMLVTHGADKYGGRIDAEVWYRESGFVSKNMAEVLISKGLAKPMK